MAKKKTDNVQEDAKVVEAVETPKVEIIRGRMPAIIVALIRRATEEATASLAAKFRTTVGKVDDIKKGRNFNYIDDEFVPTQEMKDLGLRYAEQLTGENVDLVSTQINGLDTAEDSVAFDAKRQAARKTSKKETPAETADPLVVADEQIDSATDDLVESGDTFDELTD